MLPAKPRGSVLPFMEVGFDPATCTVHTLPGLHTRPMSEWEHQIVVDDLWKILGINDLINRKTGKNNSTFLSRWCNTFAKFAMEWKSKMGNFERLSPLEVVSAFTAALPLNSLPRGSMKVAEWHGAHVPSVLCVLYRGMPKDKRCSDGEVHLCSFYKKWLQGMMDDESGNKVQEQQPHPHAAIRAFDEFVATRWIIKPDPENLKSPRSSRWQTIQSMRLFLFHDPLYKDACKDVHPGLMADLAGRWFCDSYVIPGPAGYFTGNDFARYIADVLNPYDLLSDMHKRTFIQNGLQLRQKYQRIVDPRKFFEMCMAEPATDVGLESTYTMLYLRIIEETDDGIWDIHETNDEALGPGELEKIPDADKSKRKFALDDRLLTEWYDLCKFICTSLYSIHETLHAQNSPSDEHYEPSRREVFPLLLDALELPIGQKVELIRSVRLFYDDLYKLRYREKFFPQLEATVRVPSESPYHVKVVSMFHSLQVLLIVYETQVAAAEAGPTAVSDPTVRASNAAAASGSTAVSEPINPAAVRSLTSSLIASNTATASVPTAVSDSTRWLDPERLLEDFLLCDILNDTWKNKSFPTLNSWRSCYAELLSTGSPVMKQHAVTSLCISLAKFVSSKDGTTPVDLANFAIWILAASPTHSMLLVKHASTAGKLKAEVPRHMMKKRKAVGDDRPGKFSTWMHKQEKGWRDRRSDVTHRSAEQSGLAVTAVAEQVRIVRDHPAAGNSSGTHEGLSVAFPQQCIGSLIGTRGRNIQSLERKFNVKMSIITRDGCNYVHIVAHSQAALEKAKDAILSEVRRGRQ